MSRPDRWWRPATTRRPAQRARARRTYSGSELDKTFDIGYTVGQGDERKRHERLDDGLRRLTDAIRESENGDPGPLDDLAREAAADDLLDVADAAGVTPLADVDDGDLVDELERWLRDREGDG